MPVTSSSSRLNRKALAHIALRKSKKKHANAKKEANNLIEMAAATASSSPTGVDGFVSDFNGPIYSGDKRFDDDRAAAKKVNQSHGSIEAQDTPFIKNTSDVHGGSKNKDDDNDRYRASAYEVNQSIEAQEVQDTPVITTNGLGRTINYYENSSKLYPPSAFQVNVNVTTRKYNESTKVKATEWIATDNDILDYEVNESADISVFEDKGFIDIIEGIFLNGIEGIEDEMASLLPSCTSTESTERCQLFPFNI